MSLKFLPKIYDYSHLSFSEHYKANEFCPTNSALRKAVVPNVSMFFDIFFGVDISALDVTTITINAVGASYVPSNSINTRIPFSDLINSLDFQVICTNLPPSFYCASKHRLGCIFRVMSDMQTIIYLDHVISPL